MEEFAQPKSNKDKKRECFEGRLTHADRHALTQADRYTCSQTTRQHNNELRLDRGRDWDQDQEDKTRQIKADKHDVDKKDLPPGWSSSTGQQICERVTLVYMPFQASNVDREEGGRVVIKHVQYKQRDDYANQVNNIQVTDKHWHWKTSWTKKLAENTIYIQATERPRQLNRDNSNTTQSHKQKGRWTKQTDKHTKTRHKAAMVKWDKRRDSARQHKTAQDQAGQDNTRQETREEKDSR